MPRSFDLYVDTLSAAEYERQFGPDDPEPMPDADDDDSDTDSDIGPDPEVFPDDDANIPW